MLAQRAARVRIVELYLYKKKKKNTEKKAKKSETQNKTIEKRGISKTEKIAISFAGHVWRKQIKQFHTGSK